MTEKEPALARQTEQRRYNFIRIWQKRYAHMKARAEGRSTNKSGSFGQGLMSQEQFFDWCKNKENLDTFVALYYDWFHSDFSLWFSPSIDRIDAKKGYTPDNIQWLRFSDNCEKNNRDPITHQDMGNSVSEVS